MTLRATLLRQAGIAMALLAITTGALAQADKSDAFVIKLPAEVTSIYNDLDDIEKLGLIVPLKLTSEQIDKLISAITRVRKEYEAAILPLATSPFKQLAAEVKQSRKSVLGGGSYPKDLEKRIQKLQTEYYKQRDKAEEAALKSAATAFREVFTPDQIKQAIKSAQAAVNEKKPNPKEDDKFFNLFVLGTFMTYPRIVPLLGDLKVAVGG